jgi:hypothetical protein
MPPLTFLPDAQLLPPTLQAMGAVININCDNNLDGPNVYYNYRGVCAAFIDKLQRIANCRMTLRSGGPAVT